MYVYEDDEVIRLRMKQLQTINQQGHVQANVPFIKGQIVRGRVVRLYPQNLARIEFGSFQWIAQLEAPLEHGKRYFFQVKEMKQHVHLQVIQQSEKPHNHEWQQVLQHIGVKQTKVNEQLVKRMIQANIPFTNRSFQRASSLISTAPYPSIAIDTCIYLMKRNMPVSDELFQSLMTVKSSTWTDQLMHMYREVVHKNPHVNEQLIRQLDMWLPAENQQVTHPRAHVADLFTHWLKEIGHSYERAIAEGETESLIDSLKGQLLTLIQTEGMGAYRAQSMLHFIQGMQLQSVQETAHLLSVHVQLPAIIGALRSDLHIQFEGKKTRDDSIDPSDCRIVFDLDLAAMERTFIDMHIQQKHVSFMIYNVFPTLKQIAREFEPSLIERLKEMGYIVTSIRYQSLQEKPKKLSYVRQTTEGIDMKI